MKKYLLILTALFGVLEAHSGDFSDDIVARLNKTFDSLPAPKKLDADDGTIGLAFAAQGEKVNRECREIITEIAQTIPPIVRTEEFDEISEHYDAYHKLLIKYTVFAESEDYLELRKLEQLFTNKIRALLNKEEWNVTKLIEQAKKDYQHALNHWYNQIMYVNTYRNGKLVVKEQTPAEQGMPKPSLIEYLKKARLGSRVIEKHL